MESRKTLAGRFTLVNRILLAAALPHRLASRILAILSRPGLHRVLAYVCERPALGYPRDLADSPRAGIDVANTIYDMSGDNSLEDGVVLGLVHERIHRAHGAGHEPIDSSMVQAGERAFIEERKGIKGIVFDIRD